MIVELATNKDKKKIEKYDRHIPSNRLCECINNGFVYVLRDDECQNAVVGVLRYSLFWQTIPFLDLLYIDENYRGNGHGTLMMHHWEDVMAMMNYKYCMTSTQADETAKYFYEKLEYKKVGAFLPPEQEADEFVYLKKL